MRIFTSNIQLLAVFVLLGGALLALSSGYSPNVDRPYQSALKQGSGSLDGFIFTTVLGSPGKPAKIHDAMFFQDGLFQSMECEDRCNYPPTAYFARDVAQGHEFVVEAWCPTKNATMVWRGQIEGDSVSGTVTWSARRFYWTAQMVLEFSGTRASAAEVADWRP